jgi:LysR family transcriptional regulator, flagellar master operon regulator
LHRSPDKACRGPYSQPLRLPLHLPFEVNLDIALLKTFLEVVKRRHFGKAADTLCITQSAVSARIKLLESQLGLQLLVRERKEIQLTAAGQRLLRHAETIVSGWERARQEIALAPDYSSTLAVGMALDLWKILLHDWVLRMRRQQADVALRIETHPAETLVHRLTSHLLDLTFMFEPPMMPGLETEQVLEVPLVLVASRPGLSVAEAMAGDYLLVDWGSAFNRRHAELFFDLPTPAIKLNAGALALELLLDMDGSAYLSQRMVQAEIEQGRLFPVEDAPVISRFAYAVYSPHSQRLETIRKTLLELRAGI